MAQALMLSPGQVAISLLPGILIKVALGWNKHFNSSICPFNVRIYSTHFFITPNFPQKTRFNRCRMADKL